MVNKMVTVKQFLDAGFEFVVGDTIGSMKINEPQALRINSRNSNDLVPYLYITDLVWRKNTGVMPVSSDCWVEVEQYNGRNDLGMAGEFMWLDGNGESGLDIKQWKPSLKHLEQQMNDNQETKTALEMSERDICDEIDLDISGQLDRLLEGNKAKDKLNELGYEFHQGEWLSKEEIEKQKSASERIESAYDLYISCGIQHETISFDKFKKDPIEVWLAIVDKTGYRKQ